MVVGTRQAPPCKGRVRGLATGGALANLARATSRPAATATSASPWWSDFDNLRCSAGNVRTNRKDAARVLNTHPYQLADASCSGPGCPLHVFPRYSCSRSLSMSSSRRVHPRWHPCRRREALRAVQRSDTLTDQRLSSRTATSAPQRRHRGLVPSRCPPTPQCPAQQRSSCQLHRTARRRARLRAAQWHSPSTMGGR